MLGIQSGLFSYLCPRALELTLLNLTGSLEGQSVTKSKIHRMIHSTEAYSREPFFLHTAKDKDSSPAWGQM